MPADGAEDFSEALRSQPVVPLEPRARLFQRFSEPHDESQVSAQELSVNEAVIARGATIKDALSNLGLVSLGGESGSWGGGRLSMRGFSGREPDALLEGVSLGTGFTGANALELVPTLGLASVQAYPFIPLLGLPRRGLAGAFDLSLKAGRQMHRKESLLRIERPNSLVVGHREELGCRDAQTSPLGCVQLAWQSAVRTGAQKVRDDNNTPLYGDDDVEGLLRYNDLFRSGVSVRSQKSSNSGILFETASLFGAESRGINGLPVSQSSSDNRSRKIFGLVSSKTSSLSPATGRLWRIRIDGRFDAVHFGTRRNTLDQRLRNDEREEKAVGFGLGISEPMNLWDWNGRFFIHTNFERNLYRSRFGLRGGLEAIEPGSATVSLPDSTLEGRLTLADVGAGSELMRSSDFFVRLEVFTQAMSTRQMQNCGILSPQVLCMEQSSAIVQNSPGATLEMQWILARHVVFYTLLGRTTRLPTPAELVGRPDGVAANLSLSPESALFSESGIQTRFFHSGAFFARDTNLISLRQVNPYLVKHFNSSRVHRWGFFCRSEMRLAQLEFEVAHEQVWAKAFANGSFSQHVPFTPQYHSRGTARWQLADQADSASHRSVSLHLNQTGSYTLEPEGIYRLSPPALLALEAETRLPGAQEVVHLSLKIENLLDTRLSRLAVSDAETREVAWSYLPSLPIMGRSIILSFRLLTS